MSGKKIITLGPGVTEAFKEIRVNTGASGYRYVIYKVLLRLFLDRVVLII